MIDPYAKENLYKSIVPECIENKQEIIDIISSTYIKNLINSVFDIDPSERTLYSLNSKLAKLSISASILNTEEDNAFLIAESEEILFKRSRKNVSCNLNSLLTLSDIAFYYHISSYDANAAIIADNMKQVLCSISGIPEYIRSYYENYSNFIKGDFISFSSSPQI